MSKMLVVVDMQNDFIDGALGTKEAAAIVPKVLEKIKKFKGQVFLHKRHPSGKLSGDAGREKTPCKTLYCRHKRLGTSQRYPGSCPGKS